MVWFALLVFIAFEIFMGMYRAHKKSKIRWLITYKYKGQDPSSLVTTYHPVEFWKRSGGPAIISVVEVQEDKV